MESQHELNVQSEELKRLMYIEDQSESLIKDIDMVSAKLNDAKNRRAKLDLSTPKGAAEAVEIDRNIASMQNTTA